MCRRQARREAEQAGREGAGRRGVAEFEVERAESAVARMVVWAEALVAWRGKGPQAAAEVAVAATIAEMPNHEKPRCP
jgi:hypothetical protein